MKNVLPLLLIVTAVFMGCQKDDACGAETIPEYIDLVIVNESGDNLIGWQKQFHPDTILARNPDHLVEITNDFSTIRLYYTYYASETTFPLHLHSLRADSLNITYNTIYEDECNVIYERPGQVLYNSELVESENSYLYTIVELSLYL